MLLIAITLERLGDSRSDAAYARAAALAPKDPLIMLNLAGRHARAGRLGDSLQGAAKVAELLETEEKLDAQVKYDVLFYTHSKFDKFLFLSKIARKQYFYGNTSAIC